MIVHVQTVGPRRSEAGLRQGPVCPVSNKVMFDSESRALEAAWARSRFHAGRAYLCECGAWHLTKQKRDDK